MVVISAIPALGRWGQKDSEFKASFSYKKLFVSKNIYL
jgi:hypothetical protein